MAPKTGAESEADAYARYRLKSHDDPRPMRKRLQKQMKQAAVVSYIENLTMLTEYDQKHGMFERTAQEPIAEGVSVGERGSDEQVDNDHELDDRDDEEVTDVPPVIPPPSLPLEEGDAPGIVQAVELEPDPPTRERKDTGEPMSYRRRGTEEEENPPIVEPVEEPKPEDPRWMIAPSGGGYASEPGEV